MPVRIELLEDTAEGRVIATDDVSELAWGQITAALLQFDPSADIRGRTVTVEWRVIAAAAPELAGIRRRLAVDFAYSDAARAQLVRFRQDLDRIRLLQRQPPPQLRDDEVVLALRAHGFTERDL